MSTYTVLNNNDSGADSLRDAMTNANGDPGSTIDFDPSVVGTITILSALPQIIVDMTIIGPGSLVLTVAQYDYG